MPCLNRPFLSRHLPIAIATAALLIPCAARGQASSSSSSSSSPDSRAPETPTAPIARIAQPEAAGSAITLETSEPLFYLAAIPLAFVNEMLSDVLYIAVALIWLVPDRRIERGV